MHARCPSLLPGLARPLGAACLLALSACSTPQERAAQAQTEIEQMMVVYGPACSRLGYANGSDQWRSCILSLNARNELQNYGPYPHYYGYGGWGAGRWATGWGPYW